MLAGKHAVHTGAGGDRLCKHKLTPPDEYIRQLEEVAMIKQNAKTVMGPTFWLLLVRAKAHQARMFCKKQEFCDLFTATSPAVRALWAAEGGADKFKGSLLGEVESAMMEILGKVDMQSTSSRQEALEWLEPLRDACGADGFVAAVHEGAFTMLADLVKCKDVSLGA